MATAFTPPPEYHWDADSIRGLRKFLRLSQSAFSRQLGVRQQTVSEWETGVYEPRGASSTLLCMVASTVGYGIADATGMRQQSTPQSHQGNADAHPAPFNGYSQRPAERPAVARGARRDNRNFPPSAPSTEFQEAPTRGAMFGAASPAYPDQAGRPVGGDALTGDAVPLEVPM